MLCVYLLVTYFKDASLAILQCFDTFQIIAQIYFIVYSYTCQGPILALFHSISVVDN